MAPVRKTAINSTMPHRKITRLMMEMVSLKENVAVWQGMHNMLLAGRAMEAAPISFPAK